MAIRPPDTDEMAHLSNVPGAASASTPPPPGRSRNTPRGGGRGGVFCPCVLEAGDPFGCLRAPRKVSDRRRIQSLG